MKRTFTSLLLFTLTGCTFKSNQVDALAGIFKEPSRSDVVWQARYGETVESVIAITKEPFIVFANNNGVAIAFDGWQVRSVVGFDLPEPLKIRYEDGSPQFSGRGSASFTAIDHRCDPWQYVETQSGAEWLQRCEANFYYENVIVLDASGAICRISQAVDGSGTRLVLDKI